MNDTMTESTKFNGQPSNATKNVERDGHIMTARRDELTGILYDMLKDGEVEAGGVDTWCTMTLKLNSVVYEKAALAHIIQRDFRVQRMKVCDDGKVQVTIEILEFEG